MFASLDLSMWLPAAIAPALIVLLGALPFGAAPTRGREEQTEGAPSEQARADQARILEHIASGRPAGSVIPEIIEMVQRRHPKVRCLMLLTKERDSTLLGPGNIDATVRRAFQDSLASGNSATLTRALQSAPGSSFEVGDDEPLFKALRAADPAFGLTGLRLQPVFSSSGGVLGLLAVLLSGDTADAATGFELIDSASHLCGISIDRCRADEEQRRIIRQQKVLLDIARSEDDDVDDFLRRVTQMDAETLDVERVGVWIFSEDRSEVRCTHLYRRQDGACEEGPTLKATEYPAYFNALNESRTIAATDAASDPRTSEFGDNYLKPNGISSMLDVPIRVQGRLVGIVCHEHVGRKREWMLYEQEFAASIANMIGLTYEGRERRRAERALRESEQRFRQLAENIDETFWLYDVESDQHVYISPAYETMWGRSCDEIMEDSSDWLQTIHPEDRAAQQERFERQRQGEATEAEYRLIRPDGEVRWVHDRGFAIRDDAGRVIRVAGLVEDITERKHAESELAFRLDYERFLSSVSKRFIDIAAEQIDEAINDTLQVLAEFLGVDRAYIFLFSDDRQYATNTHEYCAPGVSSAMHELVRVPRSDAPLLLDDLADGRSIQVASLDELPSGAGIERKIMKSQGIQAIAAAPMKYRGAAVGFLGVDDVQSSRVWTKDDMSMLRIVGEILTNALQRCRVEQALRQNESVLRSFFDASPMAMGIIDLINEDDILFIDVNREVADYLELPIDEIVGRTARQIGITEDGNRFWVNHYYRSAEKGGPLQLEFRREKTGEWYEAVVCPIATDPAPETSRFAFVFQDITERKHSEDHLRLLNRELNHRVKNNLAVVAALAERTAATSETISRFRESFAGRIQAMSRAHTLIAERHRRSAPLQALLEYVFADFSRESPGAVLLDGPEIELSAKSASSIALVARELIVNSAKYGSMSARDGRVEVRWRVQEGTEPPVLRFEWREKDGPSIIEPVRSGSGADLIHRLVQYDLGGELSVRYEPAGFECDISFPLRPAEQMEAYTGTVGRII